MPVADLRAALDDAIARAARIGDIDRTERARVDYLRRQLGALKVAAQRLAGEPTRFQQELEALFAGRVPEPRAFNRTAERNALERLLSGKGELADRIGAFRGQLLVPADRIEKVFAAALEACRTATASRIQLPSDERIDVLFGDAGDWAASATYVGRHRTRIRIDSREGHDVAELLHLACHEGYPGHHLQHVLIDDALVRGRGWMEFQLTPAFGSHLLISELWAEAGVDLAIPERERGRVYRETLMPLAGLDTKDAERLARVQTLTAPFAIESIDVIARYLDNERSADQTRTLLRQQALIVGPDRVIALAERRRAAAVVYGAAQRVIVDQNSRRGAVSWQKLHDVFTVTPFVMP
jgi:hypothetical protein